MDKKEKTAKELEDLYEVEFARFCQEHTIGACSGFFRIGIHPGSEPGTFHSYHGSQFGPRPLSEADKRAWDRELQELEAKLKWFDGKMNERFRLKDWP